jgi:hypothetical protein
LPQRWKGVPQGLRNAGFNLLDGPVIMMRTPLGKSMELNRWMGFALKWRNYPQFAVRAARIENGIRVFVPATAAASGYGGYRVGTAIVDRLEERDRAPTGPTGTP